jgi:hypothetical protein
MSKKKNDKLNLKGIHDPFSTIKIMNSFIWYEETTSSNNPGFKKS